MAKLLRKATAKTESKGTKAMLKRAAERRGMGLVAKPAAERKVSPDPQMQHPSMFSENGIRPSK